jgi:hypothetical protein
VSQSDATDLAVDVDVSVGVHVINLNVTSLSVDGNISESRLSHIRSLVVTIARLIRSNMDLLILFRIGTIGRSRLLMITHHTGLSSNAQSELVRKILGNDNIKLDRGAAIEIKAGEL